MPEQIKHNNNNYIVYDFDCGRDKGIADLKNTIRQYIFILDLIGQTRSH